MVKPLTVGVSAALAVLAVGLQAWCEPPDAAGIDLRARVMIGNIGTVEEGDPSGQPLNLEGERSGAGQKSVVKAMLLSAILPGLGEIYADGMRGRATGGAMATADILSMWRYFANTGDGDDKKAEYQKYAGQHYDRDSLRAYIKDVIAVYSGSEDLGFCRPGSTHDESKCNEQIDVSFPLSEEYDEDFFQQIDVYDMFVFGWDDWDPYAVEDHQDYWKDWDPGDALPDSIPRTSVNKEAYRALRRDADGFYERADRYAWIMVVGRVVSIIDSAILVKLRNVSQARFGTNPSLCFEVDVLGRPAAKVGLTMRF